ncbi:MAG TPA: pitrilysin family protein, partial [Methylomirabilota bacterium]|nr:pitrilysin family protein [Methylomirabilota bacterium]
RAAALALVAGLSLTPAAVSGQTPKPEGPALGVRFALPNGIVVLVAERPTLPIVSVRMAVDAGSVFDPPDRAGLANLTALLLARGTEGRTGPEIDRAIEFVGGSLEGEGGRDASTVALDVLRRDLSLGLDLLADVVTRPTFPPGEFDRTLEEVRAQVRQEAEDPGAVAGRLFRRLAFPGHPYRQSVTGTETSLQAISRDDVQAFYRQAYRPDGTVVAVVGAVTAGEVRAELQARLGTWGVTGAGPLPPGPAPVGTPAETELAGRDLTQATVLLGQATIARTHPDYYPLAVASHLLGGGSSARLYLRVREERGLAYSIYAQFAAGRYGGLFRVEFQSANPRVREVLALVREELVRLRRERVSDEELARAKAYLVGSLPLRMDTSRGLAALLLGIEQFGLGLDFPPRYRQAIEAVTPDDLLRAVRTHWDPDRMSLVVVADLREAGLTTPP